MYDALHHIVKIIKPKGISDAEADEFNDVIQFNNKLEKKSKEFFAQEELNEHELNVPRVITVGVTSAGKSSLCERIVKARIFPVNDKVCTLRPISISLTTNPEAKYPVFSFLEPASIDNNLFSGESTGERTGSITGPNNGVTLDHLEPNGHVDPAEHKDHRGPVGTAGFSSNGDIFGSRNALARVKTLTETGNSGARCVEYVLPAEVNLVRDEIDRRQRARQSHGDTPSFCNEEIRAQIESKSNETFVFTDLPGIFVVNERKMGSNYAASRLENQRLMDTTMSIARSYINVPNTIVLVVISSTDWIHGMNNDSLVSHLAEWLEDVRKRHPVTVYGVITKLDTQDTLSPNSPFRKIFTDTLPKDHILSGLRVEKWIPVISSPTVLNEPDEAKAQALENELIQKCLRTALSPEQLASIPMGRAALVKQLRQALLVAIANTYGDMGHKLKSMAIRTDAQLDKLPQVLHEGEKRRLFEQKLFSLNKVLYETIGISADGMHQTGGGICLIEDALHIDNLPTNKSLKYKLRVETPELFHTELRNVSLRADVFEEVKQILDYVALEQGGGFDSDALFRDVSKKIIGRYSEPCMRLVDRIAELTQMAVCRSVDRSFAMYPELQKMVYGLLISSPPSDARISQPQRKAIHSSPSKNVGVTGISMVPAFVKSAKFASTFATTGSPSGSSRGSTTDSVLGSVLGVVSQSAREITDLGVGSKKPTSVPVLPPFPAPKRTLASKTEIGTGIFSSSRNDMTHLDFLKTAAKCKIIALLDTHSSMVSSHSLWTNFETLYTQVLRKEVENKKEKEKEKDKEKESKDKEASVCDGLFQDIMGFKDLIKRIKEEGNMAIANYEHKTQKKIDPTTAGRVSKHFARIEVMGYIVRQSLSLIAYPYVIRDLCVGLFNGVLHGSYNHEQSLTTYLREQLTFDKEVEKIVFQCMEPSREDVQKRDFYTKRKEMIASLETEFCNCQSKLEKLIKIFQE